MQENHPTEPDAVVRRFGAFELDARAGELRKDGVRLKVQQKPLRFLEILLERPGEAVTREELRARLWPADVFVDFDHNLNSAANKLRDALGDAVSNPQYIETLTRGYRFIAPVSAGPRQEQLANPVALDPEPAVPSAPPVAESPRASRASRIGMGLAGGAILATLVAWYSLGLGARPSPGRIAIAVLPFQNLSAEPGQEFVSDGFTEEMIAQLGRIDPERIGVIARTSAMHYKHTTKRADEIGAELGVQYLVEGSVRRAGGQVRIDARLVRVADQAQVWAQSYDRDFGHLLSLQTEVAGSIAGQIGGAFSRPTAGAARTRRAASPAVYEAYLRGRYFLDKSPRGLEAAIGHFRQAITLDADYAPAYAGLADAYGQLGWGMSSRVAPTAAYPQARAAALRALALDDRLAEAHVALGRILWKYEWDWSGAARAFERALALDPNLATAHESYFDYLSAAGQFGAAEAALARAAALDPLSLTIAYDQGLHLARTGNYAGALDRLRQALELDPTSGFVRHVIGELHEEQGQWAAAIAELRAALDLSPESAHFVAALAHAQARSGDTTSARASLARLTERARSAYVSPHEFALVDIGLGDRESALARLEEACESRDPWLSMLGLQHRFDVLHGDRRFELLKRRLGLPIPPALRPIAAARNAPGS